MGRKAIVTLVAGLLFAVQPAAAQTQNEDGAFAALSQMFKVEPLTAEQEARLPLAQDIISKMIPPGSLRDMMGPMFDNFLNPLMQMEAETSSPKVSEKLGLESSDLALSGEEEAEIAAMFDPSWKIRKQREAAIFPQLMADMMSGMEPTMRKAMAETYAVHFNQTELTDIKGFFATESGASFARKSFTMASDPRIMAASMESLPAMMQIFGAMEQKMAEATADLATPRSFAELTDQERARISELTGYEVEDLQAWTEVPVEFDNAAEAAAEEAAAAAVDAASNAVAQ
ncbi:MAG: hypothetical protein WAT93_04380 [Pontixanthobacter sp.]